MNKTIILDCQTQTDSPYCEDCIARKNCTLRKRITREKDTVTEVVELAATVPTPTIKA